MMPDEAVSRDRVAQARRPLRILTWHVHGNYLYSLSHVPHTFVVPGTVDGRPGYGPLGKRIPWGPNISQVAAESLREERFDCVLYQHANNVRDAERLLTPAQRRLPSLYLEHNPPEPHPTDTHHPFQHARGMLVHVTHYNAVMWDSGATPARVIEHGVPAPVVRYGGELARGIVVVNHLARRGRRLGLDLFEALRSRHPLDLIGMGSGDLGGLGEIPNMEVAAFMARYRYFFSPIRYASLGLSLVEAMLCGLPVVGFAATELPTVIVNGQSGYVDTRPERLAEAMAALEHDSDLARRWGAAARLTAQTRFGMDRFVADWLQALHDLVET